MANDCIEFVGYKTPQGYGAIRREKKTYLAHRWIYQEHHKITLTPKQKVCHACDNPACINVDHLFLGSQRDNVHDMIAKGRGVNQKKTHCPKGHPYLGDNLYIDPTGRRSCRECIRDASRRYRGEKN